MWDKYQLYIYMQTWCQITKYVDDRYSSLIKERTSSWYTYDFNLLQSKNKKRKKKKKKAKKNRLLQQQQNKEPDTPTEDDVQVE